MSSSTGKRLITGPAFAVALVASCVVDPAAQLVSVERISGVGEARYEATWVPGRAALAAEGGWTVTTDLGYAVRITGGYLVAYRASLVPCATASQSVTARLRRALSPRAALAGHGDDTDPSATGKPQVEWLTHPSTLDMGTVSFDPVDYCGVHYLVARGDADTYALPGDVGMIGRSLYLEGTYVAPGTTEVVPFVVDTSEGTGVLNDLEAVSEYLDTPPGAIATVTIERRLDGLTDGIDFAADAPSTRARTLLTNLARDTRISIRVTVPNEAEQEYL